MHTPPPFLFAIDCKIREWNTLADAKAPTEPAVIHEARCVPGSLIGCGTTRDEAMASLRRLIEWTLAEESDPKAWYQRAWDKATFEDHTIFGVRFVISARDVAPVKEKRVRDVRYGALEPALC